jgi:hypothetical protein
VAALSALRGAVAYARGLGLLDGGLVGEARLQGRRWGLLLALGQVRPQRLV